MHTSTFAYIYTHQANIHKFTHINTVVVISAVCGVGFLFGAVVFRRRAHRRLDDMHNKMNSNINGNMNGSPNGVGSPDKSIYLEHGYLY